MESLRLFSEALTRHTRKVAEVPFRDWNDAIAHLFRSLSDGGPTIVVIDEFPFLVKASPALPSIIQREVGPGGSGRASAVRLVLCGSAMAVMGGLLSGQAPLRGRASLELVVQPFRYREAADFWGITDPRLAVLVGAVVGGTPAYRHEFTQGDAPAAIDDFDAWVVRTVLNPQTPLFREARYLLAEESAIRDPALYHSVLAAIAAGNNTNGGIAGYIGRRADQITHPLTILKDCALIARDPDMFRPGRARYRIVESLITFYQAIMRKRWAELEIHRADQVWATTRQTFPPRSSARISKPCAGPSPWSPVAPCSPSSPPGSAPARSTTPPTALRSRSTWSRSRPSSRTARAASSPWARPSGAR
ncbi:AAA family ATPase [Actinoplanes derwentensis]|uniref:AAA family ATPase n=1 Tax=Actinoplanes derwentensis TaxID=113562 RepID=UPI000A6F7335|nr:ATP-binding protein [Actinoplanes derwentensis]GID88629.1 hypothetical protein Ade03nite_75530 [Actinoplanes derwentensis]